MTTQNILLTGREISFAEHEVIVSKTDKTGRLTYANDIFLKVAKYEEHEVIGQQHSLVRHPEMPRAVFKLLWDTISAGQEIFAYVVNRCKDGDHYWVFAHVTPNRDEQGNIIGFHSNRRKPKTSAIAKVAPLYKQLLAIENSAPDRKIGLIRSHEALVELLNKQGISYEEFVYSL